MNGLMSEKMEAGTKLKYSPFPCAPKGTLSAGRLSLLVAEAPAGSQHSRYIPMESAFLRFGTL